MIISIANQKGGVGKTTLSILLSNFLIEKEKEILIVDFDFQSSFFNEWEQEKKSKELEPPYEVISKELEESNSVVKMVDRLDDSLIIFDLPGKLDDDNLIPLFHITDLLIVPFAYDKITVQSTLFFIQLVRHIKKDIKLLFVPNRIKSGVKYKTQEQVDNLLSEYGKITEVIPDRVCLQRTSVFSNTKEIQEVVEAPFETIYKNI